ncbi:MAG: zinc-ribbon domain-containing protein [Nitrospinota bacterium]|nr:MAG: zinc-ribbon domain-containing protein [Nitrospinota bacterium]
MEGLRLEVQQPLRSTAFRTEPAPAETRTDGRGFTYHVYHFQQVTAGQSIPITVTYRKEDSRPSVPKALPASSATETGESTPSPATLPSASSGMSASQIFFAVLMGIGILLLLYLYCFGVPGRGRPLLRTAQGTGGERPPSAGHGKNFCTQCGYRLQEDFRYCPRCGQKL